MYKQATVILDPGHGGTSSAGKSSAYGSRHPHGGDEKTINLELAHRIRAQLGPDVALTRDEDRNVSLADRARFGGQFDPHVPFVSLHSNWGYPGSNGSETWVHSQAPEQSYALASSIQQALGTATPVDGHVLAGDLGVLDPAYHGRARPACLVEARLPTDSYGAPVAPTSHQLDAIASAVAAGIRAVLGGRSSHHASDDFAYGTARIVIGAPGWQAAFDQAVSANQPFVLVLSGAKARQFLEDTVAAAARRGWDLLSPGIGTIRSIVETIGRLQAAVRDRVLAQLRDILPAWLRPALGGPVGSAPTYGEPISAIIIVAIVVVIAMVLIYFMFTEFTDSLRDQDTQRTLRRCMDRGYDLDADMNSSRTNGFELDRGNQTGQAQASGEGELHIRCTPTRR